MISSILYPFIEYDNSIKVVAGLSWDGVWRKTDGYVLERKSET